MTRHVKPNTASKRTAVREKPSESSDLDFERVPLLIGTMEVAHLLGISKSQLRRMERRGLLGPRPVRLGDRRVLWRREEIEAWVQADCPPRSEWERY